MNSEATTAKRETAASATSPDASTTNPSTTQIVTNWAAFAEVLKQYSTSQSPYVLFPKVCAELASWMQSKGDGASDEAGDGESVSLAHPRHTGMASLVSDVLAFHRMKAPHVIGDTPFVPPGKAEANYALGFVLEEVDELAQAAAKGDLPMVADAIGDAIYVLIRFSLIWGIDLAPVWRAIQAANMNKTGKPRSDGKVMKGQAFTHPDIASILAIQPPLSELYPLGELDPLGEVDPPQISSIERA